MIDLKYYELIGFDAPPNKNIVMDRLEQIKRKTVRYKLSKAKILLIKLILNEEVTFDNRDLMLLYNEISIACDNYLNNTTSPRVSELIHPDEFDEGYQRHKLTKYRKEQVHYLPAPLLPEEVSKTLQS